MGTRQQRQRQEELWVATAALARPASHPFYDRLNRLLDECQFDAFVERVCKPFYAETLGRPGLAPGIYFRLLMVGYFEGIDSERGMAWRAADSLGIRAFLRIALDEMAPDHSTISRTRRLIDVETHRLVFVWLLGILAEHGLLRGQTIGIDATTLEANAALRSIVRRDSGEQYEEFLRRLAEESGIHTPTRAELAKLDRKRAKKGSNEDWTHPHDPDARIAKMKNGRMHWHTKPSMRWIWRPERWSPSRCKPRMQAIRTRYRRRWHRPTKTSKWLRRRSKVSRMHRRSWSRARPNWSPIRAITVERWCGSG